MPGPASERRKTRSSTRPSRTRGCPSSGPLSIANSPKASNNGGKKSGSGGNSKQGGTTAQHKTAGHKGGKAAAKS